MRKYIAIIIASLALFTGQAHAQRCLPKMQGIEVRADMADGFNLGGKGAITADGVRYEMGYEDCLYITKETKEVYFDYRLSRLVRQYIKVYGCIDISDTYLIYSIFLPLLLNIQKSI